MNIATTSRITDEAFLAHCAGPGSVSKYTLSQGVQRAKLRNATIGPLLAEGMDYASAATIADQAVIEKLGE